MTESQQPPAFGNQREMLIAFNDLQRTTFLWKLEGLTEDQLRWKHQPSGMSLLGLLKHLIRVENTWFAVRLAGEESLGSPNDEDAWNPSASETFDELKKQYQQTFGRSNEIAGSLPLEQQTSTPGSSGNANSLQWILFHMIEETARHLGHADFIREAIDGGVGVNAEHEARRQAARKQTKDEQK